MSHSATTVPPPPAQETRRKSPAWKRVLFGLLLLASVAVAFWVGYWPRRERQTVLANEARNDAQTIPVVNVAKVVRAPAKGELLLPGTMKALTEAPVMARASGYVKRRLADIGDAVSEGQVLAEIEAPELDQQIRQSVSAKEQAAAAIEQSEAGLRLAKSNQNIARLTAERWRNLEAHGAVSKQENDNYQAMFEAQTANVQAAEKAISAARSNLGAADAGLARLNQLKSYQQVRAPFSGVITVRNVETGMLVTEGATLLFRVAQFGRLRVYVNVPQHDVPAIRPGMPATVSIEDSGNPPAKGVVTRMSNALDPATRTMLTEIQVSNSARTLVPGMFVMVTMSRVQAYPPLLIPGDTLVIRSDGPQVAVVGDDDRIHFQKIRLGRDLGQKLQVLEGLEEGDRIVINPGDTATEGAKVKPALIVEKAAGPNRRSGAE